MQKILTLLAMTVAIDKQVVKAEIDTFLSAAKRLNRELQDIAPLSEDQIMEWFRLNENRIQTILQGESVQVDGFIARLIMDLQSLPDTPAMLSAMLSVAAADGRFHPSEKEIIALAAAYWDCEIPKMVTR